MAADQSFPLSMEEGTNTQTATAQSSPLPSGEGQGEGLHEVPAADAMSPLRHFGGFVLAGGSAFVTDVGIFQLLQGWLGLNPLIARLLSISAAMVVSWLINRTVTFAMPGPPRLAEFLRFAAVAWISSAVNYGVFAAILLARPDIWPVAAIVAATAVAMVVSYFGMKRGVFRET